MGLDRGTEVFIDRQQLPLRKSDDIAASVGAMYLTQPSPDTRVGPTIVSIKRGSDVSGATSIFVADRYLCRSMERCICACSAYFMRLAGSSHYIAVVLLLPECLKIPHRAS